MKISFRNIVLLLSTTLVLLNYNVKADDSLKIETNIGADIVSRYVWRGLALSKAPAIQPCLDFTLGSFSIGSWASYTIGEDTIQEVDLYLSFTKSWFTLTVNDYFNPNEKVGYYDYFNWNSKQTGHAIEVSTTIADIKNIPLSLTAGVFLFGNDRDEITNKNLYSAYFELAYNKTFKNNMEFSSFIGITPYRGYYADEFNVVNVGISLAKEITISDKFTLPISGSFIVNPDLGNVHFVVAISL
ncbi:MAG: hypothetical protein IPO21_05135 [Bacteroidales bacterium]|nr:hypothetical protein [Bacteroidales bacterium]